MKLRNLSLNSDLDKLKDAQNNFNYTVATLQQHCEHNFLAEDAEAPPFRICLCCGLTEVGWEVGFVALINKDEHLGVPSISRNKIYKLRQGVIVDQDKKSKLCRNETTVAQLAKEWHDDQQN